jgi:thiol-disulfide isomerase/thioredoxin
MYRPDYYAPSRRGRRWAPLLIIGLFIGLSGAGLFNGWWSALLTATQRRQVSGVLPTPITVTERALVLSPTDTGSAAGPTRARVVEAVAAPETVALGEPAPSFTLPDLFDERIAYTLSGYRDRPVIFWASWCVPCRREMPALPAIAARFAEDGLFVLGMNQTYIDDLEAARDFVKELGLTFGNSRDDSGLVGSDSYRVVGIPTSVFISGEGDVVQIQIGEMSLEQMATYTERLIAGQPLQP